MPRGSDNVELAENPDAIDALALTPSGDRVLASFEQYRVWTVRDGKATRLEMFYDEGEAKRAAGIETAIEETT